MTDYAKSLKEKLDIVRLPKEAFDELAKDRLDFGFDSIYFRYAEALRRAGRLYVQSRSYRSGRGT